VKLVAISIDDARSKNRVRPFVNGSGWDYKVYLDPNQNLKRALNVSNPPHTFLVNGNGKIVWEHNGYSPGDEDKLYKKLKGLGSSKESKQSSGGKDGSK
ncbi:MAG: TlpA family protein disulfide reductase, partial [Flavobacteriales bacterium]